MVNSIGLWGVFGYKGASESISAGGTPLSHHEMICLVLDACCFVFGKHIWKALVVRSPRSGRAENGLL